MKRRAFMAGLTPSRVRHARADLVVKEATDAKTSGFDGERVTVIAQERVQGSQMAGRNTSIESFENQRQLTRMQRVAEEVEDGAVEDD